MHMYMYIYIYIYVHTCMMHDCIMVQIHNVYVYIYICICAYINIYIYTYIYIYTCIYIYVYIYIHIHICLDETHPCLQHCQTGPCSRVQRCREVNPPIGVTAMRTSDLKFIVRLEKRWNLWVRVLAISLRLPSSLRARQQDKFTLYREGR